MLGRLRLLLARPCLVGLLLGGGLTPPLAAEAAQDPAAVLLHAVAAAESSLREGATDGALRQYRSALAEGDLLLRELHAPQGTRLAGLTPTQRAELERRVKMELVRAYLNLGVIETQRRSFSGAAELFEQAAAIDPDFPSVQYSLGVARFNAGQFEKAQAPLVRALAGSPQDAGLKRMLAMAWLNSEAYAKAAELLRDDPERDADAALQFAYGLALARSGRPAEAQAVFAKLLARHGESAKVKVVLGQAAAQQGDFETAIRELTRARELEPDVAEASATLGVIYLKQGRLPEAEEALRAELKTRPDDVKSQNALATVLDLQGRPDEALPLLRRALESKPDFADARYQLGKILLARGATSEALEQLEAAARAAPEDANIHYQLGRAYQKLGRTEQAEEQFEVFRQLKDKRREVRP